MWNGVGGGELEKNNGVVLHINRLFYIWIEL